MDLFRLSIAITLFGFILSVIAYVDISTNMDSYQVRDLHPDRCLDVRKNVFVPCNTLDREFMI